jgi:hypothetical protein
LLGTTPYEDRLSPRPCWRCEEEQNRALRAAAAPRPARTPSGSSSNSGGCATLVVGALFIAVGYVIIQSIFPYLAAGVVVVMGVAALPC